MISFLPIPGAVFTLASRTLSPAIGFASGWIYCYGYAVDYPNKVIAAAKFMGFWTTVHPAVWITLFLIIPIAFNFFNVRRYGEIEFWFTAIKVTTIIGLILLGFLLVMGASVNPLLGTDSQFRPVPCADDMMGGCVPAPGFRSMFALSDIY
jgi:amino acid transporter